MPVVFVFLLQNCPVFSLHSVSLLSCTGGRVKQRRYLHLKDSKFGKCSLVLSDLDRLSFFFASGDIFAQNEVCRINPY